jgi:lysophospholipase L1-like esterase
MIARGRGNRKWLSLETSMSRFGVIVLSSLLTGFLAGQSIRGAETPAPSIIVNLNAVAFQPNEFTDKDNKKVPAGTTEVVDGKFGKAVKFSFVEGASGGFMSARLRPTPQWNQAGGFSFWVKGDGSDHWGGIELIDNNDYGLRYGYCFPINSTDWTKITVPWRDVIPELAGPLINSNGGYAPSGFGSLFFGKWFYWRDYPAESYTIGQITLEPNLKLEPTPDAPAGAPLARVRAKLDRHQPLTIVTMGDSLSDEHHWSNRQTVWSRLLIKELKAKYCSDVTLVNPAIGGTTLSQNLIVMPRWEKQAKSPDLVSVFFGGNDWETGVRGARFADYLRLAVDRIRRQTHGSADIVLMTPCPSHDRWETMREIEQAVREVAREKRTAMVDIAADFRKAPTADEALKREYWAWDKVHLGAKGHELVKNAVLEAIKSAQ